MNKKIYLIPLLLLAVLFTSCEETEAEVDQYANWQARSEAFIDSIAGVYAGQTDQTPAAERLYAYADEANLGQIIYVKKDPTMVGTGVPPLSTSSITAYYRGSFFTKSVFQETFYGDAPLDEPNDFFTEFNVNEVIAGWTWVLQYMKVGERWTLYIPWRSAYGSEGLSQNYVTIIPAYTALIFDLQLNSIVSE